MTGYINNNLVAVRQGDSFAINICVSENCRPVDLSTAQIRMQVRDNNNSLLFEVEGTPVDVEHGKVALLLTPEQTNIELGDYKCDIELIREDGEVHTIFPQNINQIGTLKITEQVTQGA